MKVAWLMMWNTAAVAAAEREIDLPFMPGFYAPGADYFAQFSIPNLGSISTTLLLQH